MQGLVTRRFSKSTIKIIISFAIIIFILVIICITMLLFKSNNNSYFNEKQLYIVYVEKSLKQEDLKTEQKNIKSLGGGGEIYKQKDYYYLTVSVYLNKDDAKEVVNNIKENYPEADVLSLKVKKVSKENRIKINQNKACLEFFKNINVFVNEIVEKQLMFLAGTISTRDLTTFLIEKKLKIEDIIARNESDDEFFNSILVYENLSLFYINNFLNVFFESTKKNSLVCELSINLSFLQFDLSNNL